VEPDERDLAEALDRHWDARIRGEPRSATAGLDPDLAALVTRLQAVGSALPSLFPDPDRAWRVLPQVLRPPPPGWSNEETPFPAWPHANGYADLVAEQRSTPPRPRRGGGWVAAQLATAALLLLTLAVGFVAIRQRLPEARDEATWVPALVRALQSAPSGIIDTPLIETTFTAEELPGGEKEALYYQLTIPPGAGLPYLGGQFCSCHREAIAEGVGVEIVQSGVFSLRLEAPLQVQRAGSTRPSEEVPAGTEVTLAAGDAVIYPNYAAPGDVRNAGAEPVTLTGVAIISTEESGVPLPKVPPEVRATLLTYSDSSDWESFPPGPLNVGLRRVTLPPGTSIGPYQPVGLQALWIESGPLLHSYLPAGESEPSGRPLAHLTGSTAPFARPSTSVREILATNVEQPAELLVLIIEPAITSAQSLMP
jgi:hypothetical protein